ncbi:phosphodiesterase [Aquirhabdus sp.]|uniref:phosphodiesterase n=1 Tax=Aquirhabdus sp. TaxID=2824160 RepID=UPI00396CCEAE
MLIAQLSDIHVRPKGVLYQGVVDSNKMFSDAIKHLEHLDHRPDFVLLTGDLVDQGDPLEYSHLLELLSELSIPYAVAMGNHDDRENFRAAFSAYPYLPQSGPLHYCIDDYPVRIVVLDSCVTGEDYGHIDAEGLSWISAVLNEDAYKPAIIALHHPPIVSGIPYMDVYRYLDAEPLAKILRRSSNVEAVLCGHVHRSMAKRWAGTMVLTCPSTTTEIALQLKPDAEPQSYSGSPACMLHLWHPESGLVSHTSYIGVYPGPYPFA